ncbi:hypothetical protein [Algibacter sp. 2305UL17-15]|uniref:hypothetical protein n=1 Tax=Algibacter sp. 2305UL17-15 TaxID=3231268 RepID=UPI00345A9572
MKKEPEDFEIVKDKKDDKGNYIFQKDNITKTGAVIVIVFLIILVIAVILSGVLTDFTK